MNPTLKVFKFGGASVKDADAIRNVANILQQYQEEKLVIVVSAMGKTTNALEEILKAHAKGKMEEAKTLLTKTKQAHYDICLNLFGEAHEIYDTLNDVFVEIEWVIEEEMIDPYDYVYDQIVSVGELASTKIVAAYLNHIGLKAHWQDARDLILTDNLYREAWVQWTETQENIDRILKPQLKQEGFVVTQGFIGSSSENFTTTLGREGSDYSAAILSFCLDAESMSIWKDVPGVLTADPRLFKNVTKLDRLSYREAIEMTYYGAKVIHPKTIKPLQNKSIPLYVKSFIDPEGSGTCIAADVDDLYPPMIAIEKDQALVRISTRDFSFVAEQHLKHIFEQAATHRLQINMMQNTAISFVICVNDIDDRVERFMEGIQEAYQTVLERGLELVTIRHYNKPTLKSLQDGKVILLDERSRNTVQMVTKTAPVLERIG